MLQTNEGKEAEKTLITGANACRRKGELMRKGFFALILVALAFLSLSALAESVPYTFGDFTIPVPAGHYVLTTDNHNVADIGINSILDQEFANSLFDTQPGLQMDSICLDPLYEIFVFQLPVEDVNDFSKSSPEDLEVYRKLWKGIMEQKQVTLTEETQIAAHPQTSFFYYTGTTELEGSPVYLTAYATVENNIMTTIQLQTYSGPADDSLKAVLSDIVQNTVLFAAKDSQTGVPQADVQTITHQKGDMQITLNIPNDMQEETGSQKDEYIDRQFMNNDMLILLSVSDLWDSFSDTEKTAMGLDRNNCDYEGDKLKELGLSDSMVPTDIASDITESFEDKGGAEHLVYTYTASYPQEDGTTLDIPFKSYFVLRNGYLIILQFAAISDNADLIGTADMVMSSIQYPI
jgi:hypothetical protein